MALPVLVLLTGGAFFTETLINSAPPNELFEITLLALIVSFIFFIIFGKLINVFTKERSLVRAAWLLILFFATEMVRTLLIGWQALQKNLTDQVQWDYRIVAGGLTGILFFGLRSIVLNDTTRYKLNLSELHTVQEELRKSSEVTQEDLDKNKDRIIDSIRAAVNQALQSVLNQPSSNKKNTKLVVDELIRVSEEVVRPLSHELFNDRQNFAENVKEANQKTYSGFKIFRLATYAQPFHPTATALFGLFQFFGLAVFLTENPIKASLIMTAYLAWIYLVLAVAKKYVQPKLIKVNLLIRTLIVSSIYWIATIFIFLDRRLTENLMLPYTTQLFFYLTLIGTIIAWSFAVYSAIQRARLETIESLKETNERLNWSNARLGARLWAEQKRLAAVVHRDVQGALISTALKFKKDVESGVDPNVAVNQIRDLIASASEMVNAEEDLLPPKAVIENLNSLWDGIFKVSLDIDDKTYSKILKDSVCWQTINDFIGEFVTNSVKHGKASNGKIKIELVDVNVLRIIMINNGLPLAENLTHGLGSQMVIRQSLSIVHENLPGGGVYFAATIPIG